MGLGGQPLQGAQAMAFKTEWVVSTGCACHDVHNGLKWGLTSHVNRDPIPVHKALYVAIESLRQGFDMLHRSLPTFLAKFIECVPQGSNMTWQLLDLYSTLGPPSCSFKIG